MEMKRVHAVFMATAMSALLLTGGVAVASDTSAPFYVDARELVFRRLHTPDVLTYSPYWLSAANGSGRDVRIDAVSGADTKNAVTNTLILGATGTEATYEWTLPPEAQPFCRLLHWTLEDGEPVGDALVADVVFGTSSQQGATCAADTRANTLQEIVNSRGTAALTYSTRWIPGGAAAKIEKLWCREAADSVTTNILVQTAGPAEGLFSLNTGALPSGHYCLRHSTLDMQGGAIGDGLFVEFLIVRPAGTFFSIK